MAQDGYVFRSGKWWYLRYREDALIDGTVVRQQRAVKLAPYSDTYRNESDLNDLRAEKLAGVRAAEKCPKSLETFAAYVEETYFAFARQALKPSTVAGYGDYWKRYIRPRVAELTLREFTTASVAALLKQIARAHDLNRDTVGKVRSVLCAIFSFAISEGHFPAKSAFENPGRHARIPGELTREPKAPVAASREQVQALLKAFEHMPLERAAIALMAFTGARPNEVRGMRWEDWDRKAAHIAIKRGVWRNVVGTTKTEQSQGFVTVTDELRRILLDLLNSQGCPISGPILAGSRKDKDGQLRPVILDNLSKRSIRDVLNRCAICQQPESAKHKDHEYSRDESLPVWPGWYGLRRFHATEVCKEADSETAANALRNSKEVAKKHYIKPATVLPKTRKAVNDAFDGLVQ